jgi:MHS family citrate/tricarballylate:H+ symporter-like MFS transporter
MFVSDLETRRAKIKSVIRVATGNFLEMYDFMVFGYYAPAIGRVFFPKGSEFASLMLSLATFGVGFLMRPLGALVWAPTSTATAAAGASC